MMTYEERECENRNRKMLRERAEKMQRYEITQGRVYIGSFKAESAEKALEIAPELFYDVIDSLALDGYPPLKATAI